MEHYPVLRVVAKILIPFIVLYGLYIQIHGEQSPGGGFQAGVILASAFMLHALIFGPKSTLSIVPFSFMRIACCIGVLLYAGVGVTSMMMGGHFLEYGVLLSSQQAGQHLGITLVELGVGITVCSAMLFIFFSFATREG